MADLGKTAEAGLAAEQAPYLAGPALTQTSSRTRIEEEHNGEDGKLSRTHTTDVEKDGKTATPEEEDTGLLTGFRLYAVFLALMLACFLFALDQSVSVAVTPCEVCEQRNHMCPGILCGSKIQRAEIGEGGECHCSLTSDAIRWWMAPHGHAFFVARADI
jgi:hypothetical protein